MNRMILKKVHFLFWLWIPLNYSLQGQIRDPVRIPDIPGYLILKCDLHIHTVFSDGEVWPTVRMKEAWIDGLDGIAITDHIEYSPHSKDIPSNPNRPFEIVKEEAQALDLILIRGAEITRKMPPGHLNAIFLKDAAALDLAEWRDGVKAAYEQGAFIFWNHPGWIGQQPDGKARWYPEHSELMEKGWLHGIEIVNEKEYYPEVHQWCLEKKLTMLADSDIHDPIQMVYDKTVGEHRPMTLVLAKKRSLEAIREALFARRTLVWWNENLIGEEPYLKSIFERAITIDKRDLSIKNEGTAFVQITNNSDLDFYLRTSWKTEDLSVPHLLTLYAGKTVLLGVQKISDKQLGKTAVAIPYTVTNLKIAPEKGLPVEFELNITFNQE